MKKSLLVAALIAGFVGVANADTSVTLYGRVDGGIGYQQFKGTNPTTDESFKGRKTGMADGFMGGNRWGLKGTEDLGNGLQAVFVLENGFNLSNGTGSDMFGRQATIGLKSSSWGQLDLGRQTTVSSKFLVGIASPFGRDWGQASVGSAFSAINNVRYDNMIMYRTPNFSGFQLGLNYSFTGDVDSQAFKTSGSDDPNDEAWGVALRYGNGPLAVGLSYDQYRTAELVGGGRMGGDRDNSIKSWNLAGSYDFDVVKVHAAFGQTRNGWFKNVSALGFTGVDGTGGMSNLSWTSNRDVKVNSYTVGLSAPVGASGKVLASWVMADPKDGFGANRDNKQHVYSLGYTYNLSKRTNLYGLASYGKGISFYDDLKATQFAIGLRHQF